MDQNYWRTIAVAWAVFADFRKYAFIIFLRSKRAFSFFEHFRFIIDVRIQIIRYSEYMSYDISLTQTLGGSLGGANL